MDRLNKYMEVFIMSVVFAIALAVAHQIVNITLY